MSRHEAEKKKVVRHGMGWDGPTRKPVPSRAPPSLRGSRRRHGRNHVSPVSSPPTEQPLQRRDLLCTRLCSDELSYRDVTYWTALDHEARPRWRSRGRWRVVVRPPTPHARNLGLCRFRSVYVPLTYPLSPLSLPPLSVSLLFLLWPSPLWRFRWEKSRRRDGP